MSVMPMFYEGTGGAIIARDGGFVVARIELDRMTLVEASRIMRVTLEALEAEFGGPKELPEIPAHLLGARIDISPDGSVFVGAIRPETRSLWWVGPCQIIGPDGQPMLMPAGEYHQDLDEERDAWFKGTACNKGSGRNDP